MATKISLHQFYFDAIVLARANKWRYGQAMFNHLAAVRPDLANAIRGTDKDPFYVVYLAQPNWDRFVEYIEQNWYKS